MNELLANHPAWGRGVIPAAATDSGTGTGTSGRNPAPNALVKRRIKSETVFRVGQVHDLDQARFLDVKNTYASPAGLPAAIFLAERALCGTWCAAKRVSLSQRRE